MTAKPLELKRSAYGLVAAAVTVVIAAASLMPGFASAAQLSSRSIQLSDSAPSGGVITTGVGSGTGVTYLTTFTTAAAMQSAVVEFCSNTPLIEDPGNCTAPTGMVTTGAAAAGYTVTTPTANIVKLSLASSSAAGVQTATITGVTNPSSTGALYARITTYTDAAFGAGDPYVSALNAGAFVDYGGVALYINTPISITARVMESITLCTSAANPTLNCVGATAPNIIIGHGANLVLDSTDVDSNSVYSQLSTNAQTGATIRMKNSGTVCAGLSRDGGAVCDIPAAGVLALLTQGTAEFGLQTNDAGDGAGTTVNGTAVTGGTGTAALDAYYASVTADEYAMNEASVLSTYGDDIATTAGAVNGVNIRYTFGATASNTTPAGIYTTNELLIGTGVF